MILLINNAFVKDIFREIIRTAGRIMGIFSVVLLGVAFYSGLGATGEDMKYTGDKYFDTYNLMDIRVISSYGLTDKDIGAIRAVPQVKSVYPTYAMDVQTTRNGSATIIKLHGMDIRGRYDPMNTPKVLRGRLPQRADEIVLEQDFMHGGVRLGDRIALQSGKKQDIRNKLRNNVYTLVGVVESPYYVSRERGNGSIGGGGIDVYAYISDENFISDVYTEAFVTVKAAKEEDGFSQRYKDMVADAVDAIERVGEGRYGERMAELTVTAYERINDATRTLDEAELAAQTAFAEQERALADAEGELEKGKRSTDDALRDLKRQRAQADANIERLLQGIDQVGAGLDAIQPYRDLMPDEVGAYESSRNALKDNLLNLQSGITEIDAGIIKAGNARRELNAKQDQLNMARATLEIEREQANAGFEAQREALRESRKSLDDMDEVEWFVLDREANLGFMSFSQDSEKITAIGSVFPMIFFLVAALVSLTTMTRMVEERRIEIGTLKSLGYSNMKIMSKYIIYAALPTVTGGTLGGLIGMRLFPSNIINAYRMMYSIPEPETLLLPKFLGAGIAIAVLCTIGATVVACMNELKSQPSALMRPKAPKLGKRILIERIGLVWRQLSFIYKVTLRNIFRYKKRFFMTIVGIAGCTALLITGFGVRDSVGDVVVNQFTNISNYNMTVSFSDDVKYSDINNVIKSLNTEPNVTSDMIIKSRSIDFGNASGVFESVNLIVPEQVETLYRFANLRRRATKEKLMLSDDGVIITEKLSIILGLGVGDEIIIKDGDENRYTARITGVTEHYFMHYAYMMPTVYERVFDEKPEYNAIYAQLKNNAKDERDGLGKKILDKRAVASVSFTQSIVEVFSDMVDNLNFVVMILIVSAGALAFIVLLNLTNININERIRELATIEVLGFYDREVSDYVFRENIILTLIGIVCGLFLGIVLHAYVIATVGTNMIMFGDKIKTASYIYSALLTLIFSVGVSFITRGKLKRINMVEALKSVE